MTLSALSGFCGMCNEVTSIRGLNLLFAPSGKGNGGANYREWEGDGNFALICGPCLADGVS